MVKHKILSFMLVASLLLTACGNNKEATKENEPAKQSEETTEVKDSSDQAKEDQQTSEDEKANEETKDDSKEDNEKIFTLTLFQNPKTLDIQKTNADYFIPIQIYDRLVETVVGEDGTPEIVPSLAEKWEISEDGTVYTFHLKKGVKFHNGEELKADDVLFTVEKMMDPAEATVNSAVFEKIKGAKDKLAGKADKVEGVKVIDDYTVEFTLEEPSGPFLAGLSGAPASIFNRKAVEEGKDKFGFDPEYTVGTGYMKFKDWTQDKEVNLVRNDDYFKGPAKIDGVRYLMNIDKSTERMMFENGEIDFMKLDKSSLESYENNKDYEGHIIKFLAPSMDYIVYNQKDPNMAKKEVRQAITKAINREVFNKTFYDNKGILLNGVVPPGMPGYNDKLPEIKTDVGSSNEPENDDESNFGNGYAYQIWEEGYINVKIDDKWYLFKDINLKDDGKEIPKWVAHFTGKVIGLEEDTLMVEPTHIDDEFYFKDLLTKPISLPIDNLEDSKDDFVTTEGLEGKSVDVYFGGEIKNTEKEKSQPIFLEEVYKILVK